jgi:hypothetical protein
MLEVLDKNNVLNPKRGKNHGALWGELRRQHKLFL